ncbi:hypothetical protein BJ322DRAFT_1197301, partial [Thelephora terrestris]
KRRAPQAPTESTSTHLHSTYRPSHLGIPLQHSALELEAESPAVNTDRCITHFRHSVARRPMRYRKVVVDNPSIRVDLIIVRKSTLRGHRLTPLDILPDHLIPQGAHSSTSAFDLDFLRAAVFSWFMTFATTGLHVDAEGSLQSPSALFTAARANDASTYTVFDDQGAGGVCFDEL